MCFSFVFAYLTLLCEFKVFNGKHHCFYLINWDNGIFKVFYHYFPRDTEESDLKHQDTWCLFCHLTECGGFVA